MKRIIFALMIFAGMILPGIVASQPIRYSDALSAEGFSIADASAGSVRVTFSIHRLGLDEQVANGRVYTNLSLPGSFLFNAAGSPNLPGNGRLIAIPDGAAARLKIISSRTEVIHDIDILPAPVIPKETDPGPPQIQADASVYSRDAFYPAEPVTISAPFTLRGVSVVTLGITPFQYNPVTRELHVLRDIEAEISFGGGSGTYGEERLRSRFWDPILEDALLNYASVPPVDYDHRMTANADPTGWEYLIITPTGADFQAWADTIRRFRIRQGISTVVKTLAEVGGNTTSAIETYINNAYATWNPAPAAVLLLGDYGTDASNSVISPIYNSYCVSDNIYGDVDGNHLPDISMARITANNAAQLQVMVSKFLNYEKNPPSSAYFYQHPITALGWQTERWFQICSEATGGFWKNVQLKDPIRINEVYSGTPGSAWSTATNTSTVVSYFGQSGLNYIPDLPSSLPCCWTGGNATQINTAINSGAFCLLHRDHGAETGWGEPAYWTSNINGLTNTGNQLPFIFSINCLTGKYNYSSETFAEKFHRYTYNGQNSGALGLIAASEVSYSFVNDAYLWGMMDNFWPNFMPDYGTNPASRGFMPCFGNSAGKYFLYQSSWPYNTGDKEVTYNLFHHHGDAFSVVYSEVPQNLTVNHPPTINANETSLTVTANTGSLIALTLGDQLLATATGTGSPLIMPISVALIPGQFLHVTVTKQNYYRYDAGVEVVPANGPYFVAYPIVLCSGQEVDYTDLSMGNPTAWSWSFPGGTPATSTDQNPANVVYSLPGTYDVTLIIQTLTGQETLVRPAYITVKNVEAAFSATPTTLVIGNSVTFTEQSTCNPENWSWSFPGGTPSSYIGQNPPAIQYNTTGTYDVSLTVSKPSGTDIETKTGYITVTPPVYNMTNGSLTICNGTFYDSGGPTGEYANYESYTLTIYPSTPGAMVRAVFTSFSTESGYDYLKIYNGTSSAATQIGSYHGTASPGTVVATNDAGALTFVFTSDVSVTSSGWVASINCITGVVTNPASFVAGAASQNQNNLTWAKNSAGSDVMVVWSMGSTFGTPVNGMAYTPGSVIAGGGTVLYCGPLTGFSHTGLNTSTTYYYKAFSCSPDYNYSTGMASQATTLCNIYPLSFSESFSSSTLPSCWAKQISGTNGVDKWTVSNTANAGGSAYEMKSTYQSVNPGITRLVSPPLNTVGQQTLNLSFKHYLDAYSTGCTLRIQSSTNGTTWTNEAWSVATTSSNIGPQTVNTTILNNLNAPATMIAFVIEGNLYQYDYWYIDNVLVSGDSATAIPATVSIQNMNIIDTQCFDAVQTIEVAGNGSEFAVEYGGYVTLIAGQNILLHPGTVVLPGGYLYGYIAPTGPWCNVAPAGKPVTGVIAPSSSISDSKLFSMHPNPTNGELTVTFHPGNEQKDWNLEVYDMRGVSVITERGVSGTIRINLAGYPSGIYLVRASGEGCSSVGRVVKE